MKARCIIIVKNPYITGSNMFAVAVKLMMVTGGCKLREEKCVIEVFCQVILGEAQVEVGNGLM